MTVFVGAGEGDGVALGDSVAVAEGRGVADLTSVGKGVSVGDAGDVAEAAGRMALSVATLLAVACARATASVGVADSVGPPPGPKSKKSPARTTTATIAKPAMARVGRRRCCPFARPIQGIAAGFSMTPSVCAALKRGQADQSPSRQVLAW
jgi:hypothetical protein